MIVVRPVWLAAAIGVLAPAAAWAQPLAGGRAPDIPMVRVLAALVVALACAGGVALLLRRGMARPMQWRGGRVGARFLPPRRIETIETRRISATADVCLFRCDQWEYLIVAGAAGVTVLSRSRAPGCASGDAE